MKITDAIVLGGVAVAGYMIMKNTGGGGTSPVRYITRVPRTISPVEKPVTKEPQSVPMIINLPSESVTFPAPKLPSVTSLLPPIPSEEPKTPTVTAVTKTPAPTKKESKIIPEKESETKVKPKFYQSLWDMIKKQKESKIIPEKESETKVKPKFYQSMWGGGGSGSKTTKKEQKVIPEKESETKVKPKFYQSMWSGGGGGGSSSGGSSRRSSGGSKRRSSTKSSSGSKKRSWSGRYNTPPKSFTHRHYVSM